MKGKRFSLSSGVLISVWWSPPGAYRLCDALCHSPTVFLPMLSCGCVAGRTSSCQCVEWPDKPRLRLISLKAARLI